MKKDMMNKAEKNLTELTTCQKEAIRLFKSGSNVFLSGEAGTGKSFVLNAFLSSVKDKNVMVCAPTGIAALNVGGVTLHRAFSIPCRPLGPKDRPDTVSKELLRTDLIVIDEISMCRFDVFQYVANSILMAEEQSGRSKQLIVIGDFFQLPPVITRQDRYVLNQLWGKNTFGDGYAFQSPLWGEFGFRHVILNEIVRQRDDIEFLTSLNNLRNGQLSSIDWLNENANAVENQGIFLCPTNKEVNNINNKAADSLDGDYTVFNSKSIGRVTDNDRPTSEILKLKIGMRVMAVKNDSEGRYQNGSLGTVKRISKDKSVVCVGFDNGDTADIEMHCWEIDAYKLNEENDKVEAKPVGWFYQIPLRPAYAITIHKSQGQTFDCANLNPKCFSNGQLYVAVSRLKSISGLHLTKKILPSSLKTSKDVLDFYQAGTTQVPTR